MAKSFPSQAFRLAAVAALLLGPFLSPANLRAQAMGRLSVATVMPFDYGGVAPDQAGQVSRRVHAELMELRAFALIDPVQADEFMKETAFRQEACAGVACAQRLGRKLGVEKVLMGKVTAHDATSWSVSADLIDVATGRLERSASYDHVGGFAELLDAAPKRIALQLTEESATSTPATAPVAASKAETRDSGPFSPRSGWALYTGYSGYSGTMKMEDGTQISYSGGGIPNIGVEYQWKLSAPVTLALFLEVSGSGAPSGKLAKVYDSGGPLLNGLELRYWVDRLYVGGNVGLTQTCFFDLTVESGKKKVDDLCFHGTALGPTAGYQFTNGMFIGGSIAFADLGADDHPKNDRVPRAKSATETDVWLNIGYRWSQN